jgi:hypothetical protein
MEVRGRIPCGGKGFPSVSSQNQTEPGSGADTALTRQSPGRQSAAMRGLVLKTIPAGSMKCSARLISR